jgi:hypothetical protein
LVNFQLTASEGTKISALRDGITIDACGDLCQYVGGFDGITIVGLGRAGTMDVIAAQREFFEIGFTTVETDAGTFTLAMKDVTQ